LSASGILQIADTPMYEEFYGFVQPPFTLAPDPRFLYRSESHQDAIRRLTESIARKEGFIVLAGDIGTGKTTICRALIEQLDANTFTSLILNPFLTFEELLREILLDFGVASRDAVRSGRLATATTHELISTLHEFLLSLVPIRGCGVLIIDEAQHLKPEVLEQIRVISNLETNQAKLLQIVLVGQLNLLQTLGDAEMRQLDQRISLRAFLKPLARPDVEAYIAHRLLVARGTATVTFDPAAMRAVHGYTDGVPRVINLLCDRALMIGARQRALSISEDMIDDAARELSFRRNAADVPPAAEPPARAVPRWLVAAAAAIIAIVLIVLFAPLYRLIDVTPPPAPSSPRLRVASPMTPPVPPDIQIPVRIRSESEY
jgi:general secretion pathway protein A